MNYNIWHLMTQIISNKNFSFIFVMMELVNNTAMLLHHSNMQLTSSMYSIFISMKNMQQTLEIDVWIIV